MKLFRFCEKGSLTPPAVKNANTDFSRLYQTGAAAVYFLVALPFCCMFTFPFFSRDVIGILPQLGLTLLFLLCGVAGYGLQILGARIFHLERKPQVLSYEDTTRRYRFGHAILVHIGTAVIYLAATRLGWTMLFWLGSHYDAYSVVPLTVAFFCAAMTELGGYLWFIPYSTLISMRRIGTIGVILLINFLISFAQGAQDVLLNAMNLLSLGLTVTLFVLLLNQTFITKPYGGKIARGINDEAKIYSARVVGLALACVGVVTLFTMSAVVAVVKLWYGLIKFFAAQTIASATQDTDSVDKLLDLDMAGEALRLPKGQADYWVIVFVLFAVLFITLMLIMTVPGLRDKVAEWIAQLREFFAFLFRRPSGFIKNRARRVEYLNFVDTVDTSRPELASTRISPDTFRTYAEFKRQLDDLPDNDDKIRLAYAVAARQLRHQRCGVGRSDTPREIARKVKKHGLITDIDRLTEDFETLQYAEHGLAHSGSVTLERLCEIVRTYL